MTRYSSRSEGTEPRYRTPGNEIRNSRGAQWLLVRPPESSSITRISELLCLFILPQMEDGVGAETNESPIAWLKH